MSNKMQWTVEWRGDDMVTSDSDSKFWRGNSAQALESQSTMQSPELVSLEGHESSKNPSYEESLENS